MMFLLPEHGFAACGWSDLDLGHGFHATKQGERYTLSEPAAPSSTASSPSTTTVTPQNSKRPPREESRQAKGGERKKKEQRDAVARRVDSFPQPDFFA
jgi:hypothetical protein